MYAFSMYGNNYNNVLGNGCIRYFVELLIHSTIVQEGNTRQTHDCPYVAITYALGIVRYALHA